MLRWWLTSNCQHLRWSGKKLLSCLPAWAWHYLFILTWTRGIKRKVCRIIREQGNKRRTSEESEVLQGATTTLYFVFSQILFLRCAKGHFVGESLLLYQVEASELYATEKRKGKHEASIKPRMGRQAQVNLCPIGREWANSISMEQGCCTEYRKI